MFSVPTLFFFFCARMRSPRADKAESSSPALGQGTTTRILRSVILWKDQRYDQTSKDRHSQEAVLRCVDLGSSGFFTVLEG